MFKDDKSAEGILNHSQPLAQPLLLNHSQPSTNKSHQIACLSKCPFDLFCFDSTKKSNLDLSVAKFSFISSLVKNELSFFCRYQRKEKEK